MSFSLSNINPSLYIEIPTITDFAYTTSFSLPKLNPPLHIKVDTFTDFAYTTDSTELEALTHWLPTVLESKWFIPLAFIIIMSIGWTLSLTTELSYLLVTVITLLTFSEVALLRIIFLKNYVYRTNRLPIEQAIQLQFHKNPTPRGINQKHLVDTLQSKENATIIPDGCNLNNIPVSRLIDLFNAMNTTIQIDQDGSIRTDYVNPNSPCIVADDSTPLNYLTVKKHINTLVDQIKNRTGIEGMNENDTSKQKFYDKIETLLKVIIYEIQSGKQEDSVYNDVIFQCATAVNHCAKRYIAVLSEGYERLASNIRLHSFEDTVLEELHQIRLSIISQITHNYPRHYMPQILEAHLINLGLARGIYGSRASRFSTPWSTSIKQAASLKEFDSIYTPQHIQECFEEMVNGAQTIETGNHPSNPSQFITKNLPVGKQSTIEWLGNHIPLDWSPSIRKASNQIIPLTSEHIESLFGPAFDEEERNKAAVNPQYQPLTGINRSQRIRARMFQIACTTTAGGGNIKSLGCTYVLTQLGVLNRQIDWTQLHMDTDALNTLFSYDDDNLHQAGIRF